MLSLPDFISIKTSAPFVLGAYLGIWLVATIYLNVLEAKMNGIRRELSSLEKKAVKENTLFTWLVRLTYFAVAATVIYIIAAFGRSTEESLEAALPMATYLYIAIWTVTFAYLLSIGLRLFALSKDMQAASKTIASDTSS